MGDISRGLFVKGVAASLAALALGCRTFTPTKEPLEDHVKSITHMTIMSLDFKTSLYSKDREVIYKDKTEESVPTNCATTAVAIYSDGYGSILLTTNHLATNSEKVGDRKLDHLPGDRLKVREVTRLRPYMLMLKDEARVEEKCEIIMQDPNNDIMLLRTGLILPSCKDLNPIVNVQSGLEIMIAGYPVYGTTPTITTARLLDPLTDANGNMLYTVEGKTLFEGFSGGLAHLIEGNHHVIGMVTGGVISLRDPKERVMGTLVPSNTIEKSLRDHGYGYVADAMTSRN